MPEPSRHLPLMRRLERELGDPRDAAHACSFARLLAADEAAAFPAGAGRLDELGLHRWYVPAELGGELTGAEELLQIIRVLSRRDLSLTIGHCKTYLGAVSVWLAGEPAQAKELARRVLDGAVVSFALTEREHGSDLLAGELTATADGAGFRVRGEKYLINNATRADLLCVLARTAPAGGPRGFSLVLVDKRALPRTAYRHLPKAATHGVRGADISGIELLDARVGGDALVGTAGAGLEVALQSFQITRTLCAGMSLGSADRALRIAVRFAGAHSLYGRRLAELPHAARTLAESYADLLAVEALGILGARSVQALPGELSVTSAAVKYLAPTRTDRTIAALAQLLGARALLTGPEATAEAGRGGFQKVDRDHRIVGIFDGNTLVNLNAVINQLPLLARAYAAGTTDADGLAAAATLGAPLPPIDGGRLSLVSRTGASVVQGLPALAAAIAADPAVPAGLAAQVRRLHGLADELHAGLSGFRPVPRDVPPEDFALARRYSTLFAAAACLHLWWHNRAELTGGVWRDALWVRAALVRLLHALDPAPDGPGPAGSADAGDTDDTGDAGGAVLDALLPELLRQHRDHELFSLLPCRLGESYGEHDD